MVRLLPVIAVIGLAMPAQAQSTSYLGELRKGIPALNYIKGYCNNRSVAGGIHCVEAARALCAQQYKASGATYDNTLAVLKGFDEKLQEVHYDCFMHSAIAPANQ